MSAAKVLGYRRENGRVGVRNHVAVTPLDDLSNSACEAVANNIKGTLALPHAYGRLQFGEDLELFFRTMIGTGANPNVAAAVVIGIEPEWTNRIVEGIAATGKPVTGFSIERTGDIGTVANASRQAKEYMHWASELRREECDLSEIWVSTDGAKWTLVHPQAPWEGRHCAGYAVHRDRMWIVGGDCNQYHYQNDVWSSADGVNWELVNEGVPWGSRVLHHTVAFNGKIWVMGGQTAPAHVPGPEVFHSDVWSSADGVNWTQVTERAAWSPRGMVGGSVVFENRIWLLGGGTYDTPRTPERKFHNDVWSSSDGVEWQRHIEAAPWDPRQYHDVAAFDNKMWVMEGYNRTSGNRNDVWYSADGVTWHELPNTPWAPRHAASVFVFGDGLWMVAGNNMTPDVW